MIFKLLVKAAVIFFLLIAGFSYMTYLKTGEFVMPDFLKKPDIQVPKVNFKGVSSLGSEKKDVVYKWRDGSGKLRYTSEKPVNGESYEVVEALPATKFR